MAAHNRATIELLNSIGDTAIWVISIFWIIIHIVSEERDSEILNPGKNSYRSKSKIFY